MDIEGHFQSLDERNRKGALAVAEEAREEEKRRALNGQSVNRVLMQTVHPKLLEARQKIKAANRYAEVETKNSTDGRFFVSVALKSSPNEDPSERSCWRLDYIGDDNTAVVRVRIRVPLPDQHPSREIGLFPFDSIRAEDVDKHIEQFIVTVFP